MAHFLILVGSEQEGLNAALAEAASTFLTNRGHTARRYAQLARLPHYRQELDADGVDVAVDDLREAIRDSDAVLLVTPEYNGGPSSLIKNAVDTGSRPKGESSLDGKVAAVIGATPSPGGTSSAREALQTGLSRAGAQPLETSFGVANAHQHRGDAGYDDATLAGLHEFLGELVAATETERAA